MNPHHENLEKAAQCADLLERDLRAVHSRAYEDMPILAAAVRGLIADAASIKDRLEELAACLK